MVDQWPTCCKAAMYKINGPECSALNPKEFPFELSNNGEKGQIPSVRADLETSTNLISGRGY